MDESFGIVELKAYCRDIKHFRNTLDRLSARFVGEDHQIDTYFKIPAGRLKLREGTIENYLIYYERPDSAQPKRSTVILYPAPDAASLKQILTLTLGIKTVVDKFREIYFVDNVKFHIDRVRGLGEFVEIEAIDKSGELGDSAIRNRCYHYKELMKIEDSDLIDRSYSDMLIEKSGE